MPGPRSLRLAVSGLIAVALVAVWLHAGWGTARAQDEFVDVVDFAFEPAELTVEVGATIEWDNLGSAPHTVTADDGTFDSGQLDPGETYAYTFDTAGTYDYHCEIHPEMTARIIVTEAAAPADDETTPATGAELPGAGIGTSIQGGALSVWLLLAGTLALFGAVAIRQRRTA